MSDDKPVHLTIQDCHGIKFCTRGTRELLLRHFPDYDWMDFLRNGIPISKLESIDNIMVQEAIARAKQRVEDENK